MPSLKPHAVRFAGSYSFSYDCNGNMTSRSDSTGTFTQQWDKENRLITVTGSATANFVYDGDGNRVKATLGTTTTVYIGNYYEQSGSAYKKYYYAGMQRIAVNDNGTLYWLLGDHLGSTALAANGTTGALVSEQRYKPWGEQRYPAGASTLPTRRQFTGQINDSEIGLYFYNARYYSSALGRFLSADTLVPSPSDPQQLNRYAYALNSPLNYTDPSGHVTCETLDACQGQETSTPPQQNPFRINFIGQWTDSQTDVMLLAATVTENGLRRFDFVTSNHYGEACSLCSFDERGEVWQTIFGIVTLSRIQKNMYTSEGKPYGAETFGNREGRVNTIEFYNAAFGKGASLFHNAIHEFAHLFAHHVGYTNELQRPYADLRDTQISVNGQPVAGGGFIGPGGRREAYQRTSLGYRGSPYQQDRAATPGEDFADMFLNWNLNSFANDAYGAARYEWISANMPAWIGLAVNGH